MRFQKTLLITAITLFWVCCIGLLIQREYFGETRNKITANYQNTLQEVKTEKSSRMLVYYKKISATPLGEIQTIVTPHEDHTFDIASRTKFSFPIHDPLIAEQLRQMLGLSQIPDQKFEAGLQTKARVGPDYQIKEVSFQFHSNFLQVSYQGEVKGNKLALTMIQDGHSESQEVAFPSGTMLNDNLGMSGQFPKLEVGKQVQMRCFDPITRTYQKAVSQVVKKEYFQWGNQVVSVYVVNTKLGPFQSTAWVAEDGEVLQYQFLSFLFVRDPATTTKTATTKNPERRP